MSRIQYEITMYLSKKSGSNEIVVLIRRRHFECVYFKNNILKNFLVTFIYDFWSSILSKNTHVKFHVFDQDKFQWKWTPLYNKILGGYSSSHRRNFQGVPIVHKYAYVRPCVHARHILPNQFHTDVTDTFVFLVDWTISRFTLCLSLSFSHPLTSFSFEPYPFLTTSLTTTQGYVATLSCSKAIFESRLAQIIVELTWSPRTRETKSLSDLFEFNIFNDSIWRKFFFLSWIFLSLKKIFSQ